MANIQKRGDSYSIRVSCGYDSKGKQVTTGSAQRGCRYSFSNIQTTHLV